MKRFGRLIRDRNFIFTTALVLGLAAPWAAPYLRPLLFPLLALIIMISSLSIGPEALGSPKGMLANALVGIGANYLLMTGVILAAGLFLVSDAELRTGFILMGAIPPAVAIIPFAEMLDGNRELSLFGTIGGFIVAFLLLPLITLVFIGSDILQPGRLLLILVGLIVVPFVASRPIRAWSRSAALQPYRGAATNLCFGIVFYTMVAANHDEIVGNPSSLVWLVAIGVAVMAVSGGIAAAASALFSGGHPTRVSLVLLATLKNYAVSAGLGLLLFSERAALPSVIMTILMIPYIILFDLFFGPRRK